MNNFDNIDDFLRHKVSQAQFEQKDWHWQAAEKLIDAQERKKRLGWIVLSIAVPMLLALPLVTGDSFAHQRTLSFYNNNAANIQKNTAAATFGRLHSSQSFFGKHPQPQAPTELQNTSKNTSKNTIINTTNIANITPPPPATAIYTAAIYTPTIAAYVTNAPSSIAHFAQNAVKIRAASPVVSVQNAIKPTLKIPILPKKNQKIGLNVKHSISIETGANYWRKLPKNNETDTTNVHHFAPQITLLYTATLQKWSLTSGVGYTTQSLHIPTRTITQTNYNFGFAQSTYQIKNKKQHIIQIPLLLGYQVAPNQQIQAGIYLQKPIVAEYEVRQSQLNSLVGIPSPATAADIVIKDPQKIQSVAVLRYQLQCNNRLNAFVEYQKSLQFKTHAAGLGIQVYIKK
jgi:hypothetical protein